MPRTEVRPGQIRDQLVSGSYIGNGTSQSVNVGFQPKSVRIYHLGLPEMMIKSDQFPDDDFIQLRGGSSSFIYKTSKGVTITATGFDLGASSVINNNGVSYTFEAWGSV